MLGAEHAFRRPVGLRSLVIADSPASMDLWVSEANRLRQDPPPEVQKVLLQREAAETTDSPEYVEAEKVFYARHVCRIVPNPPEVAQSFDNIAGDPTVYHIMNGAERVPRRRHAARLVVIDRLPSIAAPTLLVSGAYDEATPATSRSTATAGASARPATACPGGACVHLTIVTGRC